MLTVRNESSNFGDHAAQDGEVRRPSGVGCSCYENVIFLDEMRFALEMLDDPGSTFNNTLTDRCSLQLYREAGFGERDRLSISGKAHLQRRVFLAIQARVQTLASHGPMVAGDTSAKRQNRYISHPET